MFKRCLHLLHGCLDPGQNTIIGGIGKKKVWLSTVNMAEIEERLTFMLFKDFQHLTITVILKGRSIVLLYG
jgi:hypothetical protein